MRALLVTHLPDAPSDAGSMAQGLSRLGCLTETAAFEGLEATLATAERPTIVVIDAQDQARRGAEAIDLIKTLDDFARVPCLLAVSLRGIARLPMNAPLDDLIVTPADPSELYLRMRRLDWSFAAFQSEERLKIGELEIDLAGHEVTIAGSRIVLTHQEFALLCHLAKHRGRAFSRRQLIETLWGHDYDGGDRTVDIHVRRVRAKLAGYARLILTVRGTGYKMAASDPIA